MGVVTGGVVGTAFHGGTITQPLTIAPASPSATALEVRPPLGATAAYQPEANLYDDAGNLISQIDADGNWNIVLSPAYLAAFAIYEGTDLNTAILRAEIDSAGRDVFFNTSPGGGSFLVQLQEASGAAHTVFHIQSVGGNDITPAMGFFGAGAVGKPTVTGAKLPSDTVMASLLAALSSLGLITDSTT